VHGLGLDLLVVRGGLLVAAALADEDGRTHQEHHPGRGLHGLFGQERHRVAEQHRDRGLHQEGEADAEPHEDRAVLRGEHECRQERLVGQLDDEDREKAEGDDYGIH
jgi:hypothetical protein